LLVNSSYYVNTTLLIVNKGNLTWPTLLRYANAIFCFRWS